MAVCPNCAKKLRDNFLYCRVCGTELSGENPGDFTTEMLNVFSHEDGFVYLFSDNGNQIVLKAGSIDELAVMAHEKQYPWEFVDKSKNSHENRELVKTPQFETDFLKASSLQKPEVIATSSTSKKIEIKDESYVPDFEVSRVVDENPSKGNSFSGPARRSRFSGRRFENRHKRKSPKNDEFWQRKSQITKEFYQKRTDELNERLASHNMDKLLR